MLLGQVPVTGAEAPGVPSSLPTVSGAIVVGILLALAMAFLAVRLLETRRDLRAAQGELGFAARTAALGTLTAHLLHGLRNPVMGLHHVVANRSPQTVQESDWLAAAESTRRMKSLIEEVTRILREDSDLPGYELSLPEIFDHLCRRFHRMAAEKGVRIECEASAFRPVDNHIANLVLVILENLVANAVEASPCSGVVVLSFVEEPRGLVFRVHDEGQGVPTPLVPHLFQPGRTGKVGGSGLGLALSRQLARAAGALLDLEATGPGGTIFRLVVPKPLRSHPWSFRCSGNRLSSQETKPLCATGEPTSSWAGPSLRPGYRSVPTTST
ncbi:MAG: sensor histidine kinase [Verrucomicrobiota bacterium]